MFFLIRIKIRIRVLLTIRMKILRYPLGVWIIFTNPLQQTLPISSGVKEASVKETDHPKEFWPMFLGSPTP